MEKVTKKKLDKQTTFNLAFGLATDKYDEREKFTVLSIIQQRELRARSKKLIAPVPDAEVKPRKPLAFKKGSKSEGINKLMEQGRTPSEVFKLMKEKGQKVWYPEIYRIQKLRQEEAKYKSGN